MAIPPLIPPLIQPLIHPQVPGPPPTLPPCLAWPSPYFPPRFALSSFQSGLVVSMSLLGALAGSLITLAAGNRLGRRTELLVGASLYGVCVGGCHCLVGV